MLRWRFLARWSIEGLARDGVETTTRCVLTAPLATESRESFIFRLAIPASQPSDEAGFFQPTWSKVGGKPIGRRTISKSGGDSGAQVKVIATTSEMPARPPRSPASTVAMGTAGSRRCCGGPAGRLSVVRSFETDRRLY